MSAPINYLEDAVEAAKKAVQFDQQGEVSVSSYYYEAAARLLQQAAINCEPEKAVSLKQKASEYLGRANELKIRSPEKKMVDESSDPESKRKLKQCHFLLQQAIEEDEQGDKDDATELYTKAVEYITQFPDLFQGDLKVLTLKALDRAEELKGA